MIYVIIFLESTTDRHFLTVLTLPVQIMDLKVTLSLSICPPYSSMHSAKIDFSMDLSHFYRSFTSYISVAAEKTEGKTAVLSFIAQKQANAIKIESTIHTSTLNL